MPIEPCTLRILVGPRPTHGGGAGMTDGMEVSYQRLDALVAEEQRG
jgi:hypothetical protein